MIIDCDTHIMPSDAFSHVGASFADKAPRLELDDRGCVVNIEFPANPAHVPGTTPLPANHPSLNYMCRGNSDIDARLNDYQTMGVDSHLALPQLAGWWSYLIEPQLAIAIAHSWNLSLLGIMRRHPREILGAALMPLQDVAGAIRELEWATAEGFRALVLDWIYPVTEHPYGTTLAGHPELWPFFERVEELDVPIFLHAVQHGHRVLNCPRFLAHGLDLSAPSDAQLNLISMITSGLLDDFPELKIVHAETGAAYIKPLAKLMDARFDHMPIRYDDEGFTAGLRRRDNPSFSELILVPSTVMREKNIRYPSHYFKQNYFWTIETEEPELVDAIEFLGAERFLFATDYPHNDAGGRMKFKDVQLLHENDRISESDKEAIRSGNAKRLFKLS
jgi:predicted TIM-barrel fold metal-dependent hydrolase